MRIIINNIRNIVRYGCWICQILSRTGALIWHFLLFYISSNWCRNTHISAHCVFQEFFHYKCNEISENVIPTPFEYPLPRHASTCKCKVFMAWNKINFNELPFAMHNCVPFSHYMWWVVVVVYIYHRRYHAFCISTSCRWKGKIIIIAFYRADMQFI